MTTIGSLLVANRGEIARRVFRTARDLGITTVAVYSDADADAPHVAEADAAVRLPGTAPADTYLRADLLVEAAIRAGAGAVHPGYGFLSENAAFARAVLDAGLIWVGPSPEAIAAMGDKVAAKRLMAAAGVPVLPELEPEAVTQADLPVIIKAAAGGGGRGMRVVRALGDLPGELAAARSEARSAFGDDTVFCEPYLPSGRHVEVQVLADAHGTVWAVGERECSIQRRHQKVLEETPSPLVERVPGMRERLFGAARAAVRAIGYAGAGTVEFLADEEGHFFFLETNTRLQVEHPVTECVTGLDLVAWQLRIAEGERLPPEPPPPAGHAIEVRLYAEDPAAGWQPQHGTVHRLHVPGVAVEFAVPASHGLRLDAGVTDGVVVGIHYDPLLAKVISWAPARAEAARVLAGALERAAIHGVTSNRDLLVRVLRHPAFLAGDTDTSFLDRYDVTEPLADTETQRLAVLAAALAQDAENRRAAPVLGALPSGWRNVVSQPQWMTFEGPGGELTVGYRRARAGLVAEGYPGAALVSAEPGRVVLEVAGVRRTFAVARYRSDVHVDSPLGSVRLRVLDRFPDPVAQILPGSLLAPMPGTVVRLGAAIGDVVRAGQPLLWLEAMKMEHRIDAPADGVLTQLRAEVGHAVDTGALLAVVSSAPTGPIDDADPTDGTDPTERGTP